MVPDVHMVTLQTSTLMFLVYIDVNGCTNGHMSIPTIEQWKIVTVEIIIAE